MAKNMMPKWLRESVFYEIYPQSFADSNGDGIGDILGIIDKLDYIQGLGCNAIWINPFFDSPFRDAGYDVRDYYKVAPRYGTRADAEALMVEAHRRDMRVLLDLVPGHTSDEHQWFQKSSSDQPNNYSDWYIWTDSVWERTPDPYCSIAGYGARDGCYITNFFHFQPALNYGFVHPDPKLKWQQSVDSQGPMAVRAEMRNVMEHWLELGCDGFRVDMAESLVKGPGKMPAMREFWGEIREWLSLKYPEAVLVAEWGSPRHAIPSGFHMDFMLHFETPAYTSLLRKQSGFGMSTSNYAESFFDRSGRGNIREFLDIYEEEYAASSGKGYICIPSGNHDIVPRLAEGRDCEDLKVIFAFLLTMPGVPFIYYGDEIGMTGIRGLPSKEGGYIRTMVRTPMQWDGSENGGFSSANADDLYLPIQSDDSRPNVSDQLEDANSLLSFVREMIAFRKSSIALSADGMYRSVFAENGKVPYVYERSGGGDRFYIAINPCERSAEVHLEGLNVKGDMVKGSADITVAGTSLRLVMRGVSFVVFR